ncbi:MAG: hypothetical protein WD009_00965 [Phycisphaeraceae bacterium]
MPSATTKRQVLPVIFVERPRCPWCESVALKVRRTVRQGDDSILRFVTCRRCEKKFKIVCE